MSPDEELVTLLDSITDFFGHTLLVGLVHWVLEHQTGEVCLQPL